MGADKYCRAHRKSKCQSFGISDCQAFGIAICQTFRIASCQRNDYTDPRPNCQARHIYQQAESRLENREPSQQIESYH
jgi:hypothetical protein